MSEEVESKLGRLISRHKVAKEHIGCLDRKAGVIASDAATVLRLLKGETTGRHRGEGQFSCADESGGMTHRSATWPTPDVIAQMVAEREETQTQISELEREIHSLGFSEYLGDSAGAR